MVAVALVGGRERDVRDDARALVAEMPLVGLGVVGYEFAPCVAATCRTNITQPFALVMAALSKVLSKAVSKALSLQITNEYIRIHLLATTRVVKKGKQGDVDLY
eukprot:3368331-Pyramimonas_sp.AAC.2